MNNLLSSYLVPWGINIVFAVAIFIVGRVVASVLVQLLEKLLIRTGMDLILVNFIRNIVRSLLLLFIIIAALDQLGVDTTSLIAILGAAGLAVGLALKSSLQNFAAGVMLIIFRPFKTGDFVEAGGTSGVIEHIHIFSTTLRTPDNREVMVPNGNIYGGTITNFSARDTRRIDMVFGIGYDDDIRKARKIIEDIMDADERILKDPAASVALAELADSSVNFFVRPWVKSTDFWSVKCDLNERIKLAFDENGISIPYPQMDVHLDKT
ncbi:MAG: mechanosensitive ion channel family protein [Mariprofundaceae bacterium]